MSSPRRALARPMNAAPARARRAAMATLLAAALATPALAQPAWVPELFRDADIALGEKLIRENKCNECHVRNVGGDGMSIYNPKGRISTPGALRGMVDYCSTQLNLGLFPEEVTAVAAVLQRDHYRFKP
jgi:hypothetical protein